MFQNLNKQGKSYSLLKVNKSLPKQFITIIGGISVIILIGVLIIWCKEDQENSKQFLVLKRKLESSYKILTSHYENPNIQGCRTDEMIVSIQGIQGEFCSPQCIGANTNKFPTDVPYNVTAIPKCVLKTWTTNPFVLLLVQIKLNVEIMVHVKSLRTSVCVFIIKI